jgi:hypothetical protein
MAHHRAFKDARVCQDRWGGPLGIAVFARDARQSSRHRLAPREVRREAMAEPDQRRILVHLNVECSQVPLSFPGGIASMVARADLVVETFGWNMLSTVIRSSAPLQVPGDIRKTRADGAGNDAGSKSPIDETMGTFLMAPTPMETSRSCHLSQRATYFADGLRVPAHSLRAAAEPSASAAGAKD